MQQDMTFARARTRPPVRRPAALVVLTMAVVVTFAACEPAAGPVVAGTACPMFPADSHWHADVRGLPALPNSSALVASVGSSSGLKADFGSGLWNGGPIGIPYVVVPAGQPPVQVTFGYADESDPGPYPVPPNAPIEGGPQSTGDRHVLVVDSGACRLYELFDAHPTAGNDWTAGSGATWDLRSNALRPATWTSADAAGLPILPGLVTFDEVAAGHVDHAIRITVPASRRSYLWPARHQAGSTSDVNVPAMGERFRLKASVDEANFPVAVRPIIVALKTYGGIVADNGSPWFMSGVPDPRWDNDALQALRAIKGSDFEAIDASPLRISDSSGQARPPG